MGPRESNAIYRLVDQLSDELGDAVLARKSAPAGSARRNATLKVEWVQDIMLRVARANYESLTPAQRQRHDDAIEAYSGGAFSDYMTGTSTEDEGSGDRDTGSGAGMAGEDEEVEKVPVTHGFMVQCVAAGYLGCEKEPSGVLRYSLGSRGAAMLRNLGMTH